MRNALGIAIAFACLTTGCANIHVQALSPDGSSASGHAGLRYYMPRPYLLVTELPSNPAGGPIQKDPVDVPPPKKAGGGKDGKDPATSAPSTSDKPADNSAQSAPTTSAASGTDAGYQHLFNQYQIKLIYLPDLSRPMALTTTTGIGSVSVQPTLVDGWMLTSLQASADSKVSETLTALASLVTAQKGSAAGGGGGGSDKTGKAGAALPNERILVPGLYALEYDQKSGILSKVCSVTLFRQVEGSTTVPPCARAAPETAGPWMSPQTAQ